MIVFIGYISYFLVYQELKYQELKKDEIAHLISIDVLKNEIVEVNNDIEQSKTMEYIEKIARERLKMVKHDEIIYIFDE